MKNAAKTITQLVFFLFLFGGAMAQGQETDKSPNDAKFIPERDMVYSTKNTKARDAYIKGSTLLSENKVAEAEPYLQEAVKLDPLFVDALDHLGIVYRRQEKYEEAEKIYLQSLALNDKNAVSYINLALVYRNLNRWEDALKMYIKLNELDPEDPEAYYGIGELLQMAGDYEASKEFFYEAIKKYIAVESDLVYDALYCQGINHYELGEYEDALECFGYAEEAYPEDENLLELIRETEKMVKK